MQANQTAVIEPARGGGSPVVLYGVPWEQYEALLGALGDDHPSLRLTYLRGTLEIMTTSPEHEQYKTMFARLFELWALERDVHVNGYGGATFRKRAAERGLEPDECYVIDRLLEDVPDIAIEIVKSRAAIDKLDVYAGLGVREVWIWENQHLVVHALTGGKYVRRDRSALLPDLDLDELCSFVTLGDQTDAVRAYRDALRRRG